MRDTLNTSERGITFGLLGVMAREKVGMDARWIAYSWKSMPEDGPTLYVEVEGAIVPIGPRSKKPQFEKKDKATVRRVSLPVADHLPFILSWEKRTGKCADCEGTGQTWAGWSRVGGTRYLTCKRCVGTGKAKGAAP